MKTIPSICLALLAFSLASPIIGQDKAPNEYTDWVVTSGNYVDGPLILHLKKARV